MDTCSRLPSGFTSHSTTTCSGSSYGRGFSRTVLMTLKIAVFAPMPSVSVSNAISVNVGWRGSAPNA